MTLQLQLQTLLLSLLLLILPTISLIQPGSTLYASNTTQTWSSPNNTFSLGFIALNPPTSPPTYLASIFYSGGIPIWSAGTTPLDSSASFQFLSTGNLRLLNGSGHTVWESATSNLGVSSASLDDYGNLVLTNATLPVWSSFDHPTNTLCDTACILLLFLVLVILRSTGMIVFVLCTGIEAWILPTLIET